MFNSVSLTDGVLSIVGNATVGSHLTANLIDSGKVIDASGDDYHDIDVALSSVKSIQITGGSGADYIFVDSNIKLPVTINGGDGNDTVRGGGAGNTILEGNGNDSITIGGTGGYVKVGNGNDNVAGSPGNDTIIAGNGKDTLDGADGNDSIAAGNGNDSITGDAGNDTLVAGNGADTVNGGLGNDDLTVGTGNSVVIPGSGTNHIVLGNPKATVIPSAGDNTIVNTAGQIISGGSSSSSSGSASSGTSSSGSTSAAGTTAGSGSTSPTGSTSWVTYSGTKPASSTAPQAILKLLAPNPIVGAAIDVDGTSSVLGTGSPIDANYNWNFGDPNGEYNTLPGFNASHVYTAPGKYTITLTVTNSSHEISTASTVVTIAADNRRVIYVDSVHGSNSNSGSSPSTAVQTAAFADSLISDNTEILFDRGETFNLGGSFLLHDRNLLIGAYGSGAQPIMNYTTSGTGTNIFSANSALSIAVTIQDLTFITMNGSNPSLTGPPMAVMAGGTDIAVLRCTFKYVAYGVNASGAPNGLTIEDSSSPLANGLQGYFLWDQGTDSVVIGNTVAGSNQEHVLRSSSASDILVMNNNFTNNDGKGCIEIHEGGYAWVDSNTVHGGDIRVGPLGLWGEPVTSATNDCVIQNNIVDNSFIAVDPGSHDISIRNNVISRNSAMMIDVAGTDSAGRVSSDIRILNNTGISTGTVGNFLKLENHVDGITLENNLLVMPNLTIGGDNSGPVYLVEGNFSSFTYINGNVWQEPVSISLDAKGGINLVGTTPGTPGSMTAANWNAEPVVGTDYFAKTTLNSSDAPSSGNVAATVDAPVAGVLTDIHGAVRPSDGAWTAGAVQIQGE